jgi:hypothetical protein
MNVEKRREIVRRRMAFYMRYNGDFALPYGVAPALASEINEEYDADVTPQNIYDDVEKIRQEVSEAAEALKQSLDPEKGLLSEAHSLENAEEVEKHEQ